MSTRRLVVVGADGAGMSAAHQALRTARARGRHLEVIALEKTQHTSYSACGIPYWMAGDVDSGADLVARTADEHRALGVDLRLGHQAVELDTDGGRLAVRDLAGGRSYTLGFDDILLATGAEPLLPDWSRDVPGVLPVKTLDDGAAWRRLLAEGPRSAAVVGGGYIGVETAEAFARRGISTTLVTRGEEPMSSSFEPHLAALLRRGLEDSGVTVVTGAEVRDITRDGTAATGRLRVICSGGQEYAADVVAVGTGVRPRVELAADAGLPLGRYGGLVTDDRQQLTDGIWAAGDCCEVFDRVVGSHQFIPLGTHANKTGRVAGTVLGGGDARFPGVVGTAITRAGHAEAARVGVPLDRLGRMGLTKADVATVTMESTTAAGYMPEADPVTVWVMAHRGTGRLLGCQLVGGRGAGKRIDTAATAIWAGLDVGQIAMLDLAYAPPFSPVWDPVQIACRKLAEQL